MRAFINSEEDEKFATERIWVEGLPRFFPMQRLCDVFENKGYPISCGMGDKFKAWLEFKSLEIAIAAFRHGTIYSCEIMRIEKLDVYWDRWEDEKN